MKCKALTTCLFLIILFNNCATAESSEKASSFDLKQYSLAGTFVLPDGAKLFDILPDGRIIALAGNAILIEKAVGTHKFTELGELKGASFASFGPAFLRMSPDGIFIAVGDNNGKIGIFKTDTLEGKWFAFNHYDAEWFSNTHLAVTHADIGKPSQVSVININLSESIFNPKTVLNNLGGASAGITFDEKGNLYTGNGYKTTGPSATGTVKFFDHAQWSSALKNGSPIDFEAKGKTIISILSAASLGFDAQGTLHIGGSNVFGGDPDINYAALVSKDAVEKAVKESKPVDPNNSEAVRRLDPDKEDSSSTYTINFNRKNKELYLTPINSKTTYIYRVKKSSCRVSQNILKVNSGDIRIVSYNIGGNYITNSRLNDTFERILSAVAPDVIVFQEYSCTVLSQLSSRLAKVLGGTWHIYGGIRSGLFQNVIASRFPLKKKSQDTVPPSAIRGVTAALLDLPDSTYEKDIYLMGIHFQCCDAPSYQKQRQRAADAVIAWIADARSAGSNIDLPVNTPIIVGGDFNFVGDSQPETTLLSGNIVDESTFGVDSKPDWDGSNMTDAMPEDLLTGNSNTWSSSKQHPTVRFDRFYYTDSVLSVVKTFILNTLNLTTEQLAAVKLKKQDTLNASDHLPIVMDLRLR